MEETRSWGSGIYFCFLKRGAQGPVGRQAAWADHPLIPFLSPGLGLAPNKGSPGPASSPSLASLDLELGTQRPESMQRCMWYFASCREKAAGEAALPPAGGPPVPCSSSSLLAAISEPVACECGWCRRDRTLSFT